MYNKIINFLYTLVFERKNKKFTNLKAGNGCPCAGQVKLKIDDFSIVNAFILSLEENFGSALPTGSIWIWKLESRKCMISNVNYLNAGIGYPWAGQLIPISKPMLTLKWLNFSFAEIFGAALPTGSRNS